MKDTPSAEAWNNFVLNSRIDSYEKGSPRRSAAIANRYWGGANSGGINSFLTNTWELDAAEVLIALRAVGASKAAAEFEYVLRELRVELPVSSQDERFDLIDEHWTNVLNQNDLLSNNADRDIMQALEEHVREHEAFYLALNK